MRKYQLSTFVIITSLLTGLVNISNFAYSNPVSTENVQFTCSESYDQTQNEYFFTTFAWNPESKKPLILWKRDFWTSKGLDPQTRCEEVTPRFQKAYNNGTLKFLRNGTINNQPVICTVPKIGDGCDFGTLLLTLLPEDNIVYTTNSIYLLKNSL
ncbi:MAG: COP23 domain-containing protein [Cyanobacteria bacterium P01_G01_bin.39]